MKRHLTHLLRLSGSLLLCLLFSTSMSFAQTPDPGGTWESIQDDDRFKIANKPTSKPVEGEEKALSSTYTFQGRGNWSLDAVGSNNTPVGTIQAIVPPGSYVEQAYLYCSMFTNNIVPTVVFEGTTYSGADWTSLGQPRTFLEAFRTDVTTQIRALIGSGSASTFNFTVNSESPNGSIDGEALVIIYSNPSEDGRQIIIYDGAASPSGDNTVINFPSAIPSVSSPNFEATLSLGIGFSCCGQTSEVDINGTRLTSTAGNKDDGLTTEYNGTLITIGGIGDSRSNPVDPNNGDYDNDDELYDIGSFLSDGDNSITLNTRNPTNDDIIFFMGVNIASEVFNPCDEGDIAAPAITCPDNQVVDCNATLTDYTTQVTVTDNCDDDPTVTQTPPAGTDVGGGVTVTLTATDASGNSTSCSFFVGPQATITCPGNQQSCDEVLADYTNQATASGFCGGNIMITQTPPAGTAFTGTVTVTLTAMDDAGGTASCSFEVGPPMDADMDGYTQCEGDCDDNDPTVYPNAPEICDGKDNDCDGQMEMATVYTVGFSDLIGMSISCNSDRPYGGSNIGFTWISANNQTPTSVTVDFLIGVDCHSTGQTRTTSLNSNAQTASFTSDGANCTCSNVTYPVSLSLDPADYVSGGQNTFLIDGFTSFGFQDLGNDVFARVCVEYDDEVDPCDNDTTPPSFNCLSNQAINLDANCMASMPDYTGSVSPTDDCDQNPTVTQSPTPGTPITAPGNTTVTLTATDASGNSTSCSFQLMARDVTPPSLTCPATQSETADANCEATLSDYTSLATVSDACDNNPTVTQSPTAGTTITGNTTVTLIATDASGNSTSCTFMVVLDDTTPPSLTCPGTQSETADANCEATLSDYRGLATVSDNCDANPTVIQMPMPGTTITGNTLVTLMATDGSGNGTSCTFTVELDDTTPPSISCPGTQYVNLDDNCSASMPNYTGQAGVSDNCDGNPVVTQSPTPGSPISGEGNTTVTLIATDASGNSTSCSFTVTAQDVTPPTITCAADFTVPNDEGECRALVTFPIPQWDDNCFRSLLQFRYRTVDAYDNPTGDWTEWTGGFNTAYFDVDRYEFEWRAQDRVPNYNYCYYFMEVLDTEAPDAICLNPTVYLEPDGTYTLSDYEVFDFENSEDNCSAITVTAISPATVDCDDFDTTVPVTVTVTDEAGNTAQCTANVFVQKGDALPSGWNHDDVGGATGDAGFDPCEEKFFVESNGYTHPLSDKVHYAYQYLCGDMEITARVVSVDPHGFGGIMIRESLDGGSKKVAMRTQLQPFVHRDVRAVEDGYQQTQQLFRPLHSWLRIKRIGNMFIGYTSTNGFQWTFAFFSNVEMNSCIKVGLFAEGPIDNTISRACFDNVSITGGIQPALVDNDGNGWETNTTRAVDFNIFPNPATNEVNVNLTPFEDEVFTLRVFNNLGQEVFRKEYLYLEEYIEKLDLSQYNSGIYMLNIELEDGTILNKKFVVNRK